MSHHYQVIKLPEADGKEGANDSCGITLECADIWIHSFTQRGCLDPAASLLAQG